MTDFPVQLYINIHFLELQENFETFFDFFYFKFKIKLKLKKSSRL